MSNLLSGYIYILTLKIKEKQFLIFKYFKDIGA